MSYQPTIEDAPTKAPKETTFKLNQLTPRKLDFDKYEHTTSTNQILVPGKLIQPYDQIEWVYPNDEESQFYTYEQMLNDWVPSDIEDDDTSEDDSCNQDYYEDDTDWY